MGLVSFRVVQVSVCGCESYSGRVCVDGKVQVAKVGD